MRRPLGAETADRSKFRIRIWVAGLFAMLCLGLIVARLWVLQVDRHDGFVQRADSNRTAFVPIPPRRGDIVDRYGEVLARNQLNYTLEMMPAQVKFIDKTLSELSEVVNLSEYEIRRFKRKLQDSSRYAHVVLRNNLNDVEAAWFASQSFRFPGVKLKGRWVRDYPQGEAAAHVVGYIGRISENDQDALENAGQTGNYRGTDVIGKKGVEKTYEHVLHGLTGSESIEVNAKGRVLRSLNRNDPNAGQDLVLTIDMRLQRIAEQAFEGQRGALVAIDPSNGEILAFVSRPAFDPNLFVDGIDVESWRQLNESEDFPLINRPLFGTYPIGSTYKPFVALAALELKKRNAKDIIYDPGYYELGTQRYRNSGSTAYGAIDMHRALVVSSDAYFYSLAPVIPIDLLHDFMAQFGFGKKTEIDLDGEKAGVLPSTGWKRKAFKRREDQSWYQGETVSSLVGQGYNSFTLLQLAQATSVLANMGVLRQPHIVLAIKDARTGEAVPIQIKPPQNLSLNPANIKVVRDAMVDVTKFGTARRAFEGVSYDVAGKTGTAQLFSLKGGKYISETVNERLRDHSLFMGFAPAKNPKIALAVLVENAGWGGAVAAPIARKVFDAWVLPNKPVQSAPTQPALGIKP
jgi:penicillin-binding protein 2